MSFGEIESSFLIYTLLHLESKKEDCVSVSSQTERLSQTYCRLFDKLQVVCTTQTVLSS